MEGSIFEKIIMDKDKAEDASIYKDDTQLFSMYMMMYRGAIREVTTKLEVLNDEFKVTYARNPIKNIKSRIKKPESIIDKLRRRGYEVNVESMVENLNDIAGVRVICDYSSDIYAIAQILTKQDDVKVLILKDYIKNPKPNGYRSLHLVIEVPVFFSNKKVPMKVEVQIRTMAMDFWASLEHHIKYKTDDNIDEHIAAELKACAESIHDTDERMQKIYEAVQRL